MSEPKLYIPVLLGTTREGRVSELAAKAVLAEAKTLPDLETELVDPRNFKFPEDGKTFQDPAFSAIAARADGFFIVTPEYNHGYPPSLKRMLDSEDDFSHYRIKPAAIAGVSDGNWGGVRVIEALLPVLRAMDMYVGSRDVHFFKAPEQFDAEGNLQNENIRAEIQKTWADLLKKARLLKPGREAA